MSTESSRIRHVLLALVAIAALVTGMVVATHHRASRAVVAGPAAVRPIPIPFPGIPVLPAEAIAGAALRTSPPAAQTWPGIRLIPEQPPLRAGPPPHAPIAVNAAGGILIDVDSGEIMWQQNPHVALPPASTTKILTALVALQNFDPQRVVAITPEALHAEYDETLMGLQNGEKLTVEELLTGALLVSGNDAATALAVDTVGLDAYVAGMNAQVQALGLHDSHFSTPVGLDAPDLRASAYDLAVIARTAIQTFPLFQKLVATPQTTLPATATHHQFDLWNLNDLLRTYPGAAGVKPGFTGAAGSCLVGMAVRGGHRVMSVLLNAPLPVTQTRALLDWGFAQEGVAPIPATAPPRHPRQPPIQPLPRRMRLTVLGSGDAFSGCGCNAGYAVDGRLLIDAGAPGHVLLPRAGLEVAAVETILITHFHADHTFMLPIFLGALMVTPQRSSNIVVAGPVGLREYVERLVTAGFGQHFVELLRDRVAPTYRVLQDGSDEMINGYRIRAHAVVHSTGPSLAYAVSDGTGATTGFSGDSVPCAGLQRVIGMADLMVCECTSWEEPIPGHLWREEVATLMAANPGTRFLLSHLTGRQPLSGALVAHDLLTLEVSRP